MWWVNQLTKVFTYAVILETPGKSAEVWQYYKQQQKVCYTTNHLVPYLACTPPAPVLTEPGLISLPVLSHAAVPTVLPSACQPSYPVVCHPAPLCPLVSACFHPCPLPQASAALLLTFSLLFILPHTLGSCILPRPYHFSIWGSPASPSPITPSIPVSFSLHLLSSLPPVPVSALVFALLHSQKTPDPYIFVWMLKLFALLSSTALFISHFNHSLWLTVTLQLKKELQTNSNKTPWWDIGWCGFLSLVPVKQTGPSLKARAQVAVLLGVQPLLEIPRLKPRTSQTVHLAPYLMTKIMPLAGTEESPKI